MIQKVELISKKPLIGKKKKAVAKANLYNSNEEGLTILVNNKNVDKSELNFILSELPIKWFEQLENPLIKVWVKGGGTSSQRLAVLKAIAKILIERLPVIKPMIKRSNHAYFDWRRVERKHPGNRKARKEPAWNRR